MSSPIIGESSGRRTSLKRLSDSDHFTNNTSSPHSSRKIDIDCSPSKKVRFSDHFPSLSQPADPLTEVNLKQHNKRIVFADDGRHLPRSNAMVAPPQTTPGNCVMKAWLNDRYDFEWIWASKGGSASTEDSSYDAIDEKATYQMQSCR